VHLHKVCICSDAQGKTTLLKIVSGLAQHDSGDVFIGPAAAAAAAAAVAAQAAGASANGSLNSSSGATAGSSNGAGGTSSAGGGATAGSGLAAAARTAQTGLVFQFPERHFLGATIAEELTFGWAQRPEDMFIRQQMSLRLGKVRCQPLRQLFASPQWIECGLWRRTLLCSGIRQHGMRRRTALRVCAHGLYHTTRHRHSSPCGGATGLTAGEVVVTVDN